MPQEYPDYFTQEAAILAGIKNAKEFDPQAVGEYVADLASRFGVCSPDVFVRHAMPGTVVHKHFEWDDRKCGVAYRRDQARIMMRAMRIVAVPDTEPIRAFIAVHNDGGRGYVPVHEVLTDAHVLTSILDGLSRKVAALEDEASRFIEVAEALRAVKEAIRTKREGLHKRPKRRGRPPPSDEIRT